MAAGWKTGGVIAADGTGLSDNLETPINPPAYDTYPAGTIDRLVLVGPVSNTSPTQPPINTFAGWTVKTTFHDWYYRIHLVPPRFELGNLVGRQQRTITLWNAFFVPVNLESFTLDNAEGITVTQPVVPPAVVKPLKLLRYQVEISTEGPPVIDATATWTIDGVEYVVPFTGRRIVVFPFRPNWSAPVEETLEAQTTLDTSYTGKEQVSETRAIPDRIIQYTTRLHNFDVNLFDSVMYGWSGRFFALPLWQEKTRTKADAVIGDQVLQVATQGRTLSPGALAILFKDVREYEIVEVESATSSSVNLSRPLAADWPRGTALFPVMVSAIDAETSTSRVIDNHLDALVRFVCSPAENNPRLNVVAPPATYRGVELYTKETNWIAPLPVNISSREDRPRAQGTGIYRLIRRAPFPLITRGFRWLNKDRLASEELREFFARRRGRLKPVWIPSGTVDFRLLASAVAADATIRVEENNYGQMVALQAARRDIIIIMRNGTRICRRITAYGIDEFGRGTLTLDSSVDQDLNLNNVKKISYLGFWRLTSDQFTFSWATDGVSLVETNFTLKEAP